MNILTKIADLIHNLFSRIPKELREYAEIALSITGKIRAALASDTAIAIDDLIPVDIDGEARIRLIAALDDIIQWLHLIKGLPEILQKAVLGKAASHIVAALDGNELRSNQYDSITQIVFSKHK